MTETTQAADTAAMRAEADQLMASVRDDNRSLYERHRRAVQLEYEAGLIDDRDMCAAELEGCRSRLPQLREAVEDAKAAERAAEDRRDADVRHRDQRIAEEQKADADPAATPEEQEDAGIRVSKAGKRLAVSEASLAGAQQAHQKARDELTAWAKHVAGLEREHSALDRKAANPGIAPNMPALAPGVAKVSDLDEETRQHLGLLAILTSQLGSGREGQQLPNSDLRQVFAQQDPGQMRFVRTGDGRTLAIPPARRP